MAKKPFSSNPLFKMAGAQVKAYARRAFARSPAGQLLQAVRAGSKSVYSAGQSAKQLKNFVQKYGKGGSPVKMAMNMLRGTELGDMAAEVEKYAKQSKGGVTYSLLKEFLGNLGPAGKLLGSLLSPQAKAGYGSGLKGELQAAMNFIEAFSGDNEAYEVARRIIEGRGGRVIDPADVSGGGNVRRGSGQDVQTQQQGAPQVPTKQQAQRTTADVPMGSGGTQRFPKNHPIVTGAMQTTPQSSNVYSYAYDVDNWYLYVRFKAEAPRGGARPNSPGPLYQYANVPPRVFMGMLKAASKGTYIWDNIRIRGTLSGHRFDYQLVGISGGYVPRKATMGAGGEWYMQREVRAAGGKRIRSSRPNQLVRPLVSTGAPNRGNSGAPKPPNRGKPRRT